MRMENYIRHPGNKVLKLLGNCTASRMKQGPKSKMFNIPDQRPSGRLPRFAGPLARLGALFTRRRNAASIDNLTRQLREKEAIIEAQAAALAHSAKIFNRASNAARIGVWQCSLPDETLIWTDVVFDMFDLPRDRMPERETTLACYTEASARELKALRDRAILECTGFSMDAEIVTAKGNHRWLKITATVECDAGVPVRIFGIKQDITEAKLLLDRTRYLADFDLMTGLANRAQFQSRLTEFCRVNDRPEAEAALLLIDLDSFKAVNDTYGHASGDDCLREAAERLRSVCGKASLIARIGGDEFAVLLQADADRDAIAELARDIVQIIRRPIQLADCRLQIGASVGIALVDGLSPQDLFQRADTALYAAKAAGRNGFHLFEASGGPPLREPRSAA
jgi:diguanylate cyclase (GGDEF)-like protein